MEMVKPQMAAWDRSHAKVVDNHWMETSSWAIVGQRFGHCLTTGLSAEEEVANFHLLLLWIGLVHVKMAWKQSPFAVAIEVAPGTEVRYLLELHPSPLWPVRFLEV